MANNADAIDLMNENTRLKAEVERLREELKHNDAASYSSMVYWRALLQGAERYLRLVVERLEKHDVSHPGPCCVREIRRVDITGDLTPSDEGSH